MRKMKVVEGSEPLRMYDELAEWWPLLSAPADYAEEASFYAAVMKSHGSPHPRTVLELGSGGGNNASHLKRDFQLALVDLSPGMLAQSRKLNPECEHFVGDMRSVRLDRKFDRVFVHDAVCYMTSETDLSLAMETAYTHCVPGGSVLFAPDNVTETFRATTDHGGEDGDGRSMRYLEWAYDPDSQDSVYTVDYAFILREADGEVRVVHDRHQEGLFSRETWLRLLTETGFEAKVIPFEHSEVDGQLEVFVGLRPE